MGWNPAIGSYGNRSRTSGGSFRLWVTLGWLAVIGAVFVLGYQLAYHDADSGRLEIQALRAERQSLTEQLMAAEEQVARLERGRSIDQEAKRLAQTQLEELQDERHEFAKQVSALERLIREGGGGVVQVQDFELWRTEAPHEYRYRFTVAQLIPEFGQASGRVSVRLDGQEEDGAGVSRGAADLLGSEPADHSMDFEFFQHFSGTLVVPDDIQPLTITVEVEPSVRNLISSSRTYSWEPEPFDALRLGEPVETSDSGVD